MPHVGCAFTYTDTSLNVTGLFKIFDTDIFMNSLFVKGPVYVQVMPGKFVRCVGKSNFSIVFERNQVSSF